MQIKKWKRIDQFNMKNKCSEFRITIIHGSRNILLRDLMIWNKSEHKKYDFVLILCLFLGSTC